MLILPFSIASKYTEICTPDICLMLDLCAFAFTLVDFRLFLFNLSTSLWLDVTEGLCWAWSHTVFGWSVFPKDFAHCLNCAMSFLLGSFLYALRDEHMFSLDLFYVSICSTPGTHSHNTVQDMSAGHSPNDRCTSSELTRTDRERATTN